MGRTFTLQEAQTLLPVLESLLKHAQEYSLHATKFEYEMQQLSQRIHFSGGMQVDVIAAARRRAERDKAAQQARDTLTEIEEIGVTVQDLAAGLLDFPCQIDGSTVLLCWKLGEPTITYWHTTEESFEARKPLDARFHRTDREHLN